MFYICKRLFWDTCLDFGFNYRRAAFCPLLSVSVSLTHSTPRGSCVYKDHRNEGIYTWNLDLKVGTCSSFSATTVFFRMRCEKLLNKAAPHPYLEANLSFKTYSYNTKHLCDSFCSESLDKNVMCQWILFPFTVPFSCWVLQPVPSHFNKLI